MNPWRKVGYCLLVAVAGMASVVEAGTLPSGYLRLMSITSSGKAYIDTGYKPTDKTRVETHYNLLSSAASQSSWAAVFGVTYNCTFAAMTLHIDSQWELGCGGFNSGRQMVGTSKLGPFTGEHELTLDQSGCTVDGTLACTFSNVAEFISGHSLLIFANRDAWAEQGEEGYGRYNPIDWFSNMELYSFKISEEEAGEYELKHDYVPCQRVVDSTVGLYDLVTGDFLVNDGTGLFIPGEIVETLPLMVKAEAGVTSADILATVSLPCASSVQCELAANGRVQTLEAQAAAAGEEVEVAFVATGLMPDTPYTVTATAYTNGTEVAATYTLIVSTQNESGGKCKYVLFSGNQYVNTGFKPSRNHRIELVYEPTEFCDQAHVLGNLGSDNWYYINWTEYNLSGRRTYYLGRDGTTGGDWGTWSAGRHTLVLNEYANDNYTHTFDGAVIASGKDVYAEMMDRELYLNFRGTLSQIYSEHAFRGRIYSLKIRDNQTGALVANFEPRPHPTEANGGRFYETISGDYIYAQGGTLGYGEATSKGNTNYDVRSVHLDGTTLALDFSLAHTAGELKCYYANGLADETTTEWSGSIKIGDVGTALTSIVCQVELPAGAAYIRLAVEEAGAGPVWGPFYALAWLPSAPSAAMPDTQRLLADYVARFNAGDNELYQNAIPNAQALDFLSNNVPRFACPDSDLERTYYFRWWTYRKHLRHDLGIWTVSEFLPNVNWAGLGNTIVCPVGHHAREGRWLRNPQYVAEDLNFWLTDSRATHRYDYVSWLFTAACQFADVTGDGAFTTKLLDDAARYYDTWETGFTKESRQGGDGAGGFFSTDGREGSEMSLSGYGYRPLVNAAMWSEAESIARAARRAGRTDLADKYAAKAALTAAAMAQRCWNESLGFFTVGTTGGEAGTVRELHGYAPWYFGLDTGALTADWSQLADVDGFAALYGLSFPERRAPGFTIAYSGHECQWNGPSWPFATSIALTALANDIRANAAVRAARQDLYVALLRQYARQHALSYSSHATADSVVPWIDEDFDEDTFNWIARTILNNAVERGKDYNHSTFCDLVISGLVGLVPNGVGSLVVDPLVPADWDYYALEDVRYHGHDVSIRFERGTTGYRILLDGKTVFTAAEPVRTEIRFAEKDNGVIRELVGGEVSLSLFGHELTLAVAANAVAEQADAVIAWDQRDRGEDLAGWANVVNLGLRIGPAGATNVLDAAALGIPDRATCRVFFVSRAVRSPLYISARDGQHFNLGIKENQVYGFDFGFGLNAASPNDQWRSILSGTINQFTLGEIAGQHRQIYLRHRTAEAWANSPVTDVLLEDQLTNMAACNRAVLSNGTFTVNSIVLKSGLNPSESVNAGNSDVFLFHNAATGGMYDPADARFFYLSLYGQDGSLVRDYRPALDNDGVPCLYERLSGDYYYAIGGQSALEYDPETVTTSIGEDGIFGYSDKFKFYSDSTLISNGGLMIMFK